MALVGIPEVLKNINSIYERKKIMTYALCLETAERALQWFRQLQESELFWKNRTGLAKDNMSTEAKMTSNYISWLMAHGMRYGEYLETSNDGQNEAIRPTIKHFLYRFKRDVEKIWGHSVGKIKMTENI